MNNIMKNAAALGARYVHINENEGLVVWFEAFTAAAEYEEMLYSVGRGGGHTWDVVRGDPADISRRLQRARAVMMGERGGEDGD